MFGHLREKFREVAKHPKGMLAAGNIVREPGPVDEKVATALATYDAAVVSSVAVDKGCHAAWAEVAAASEAFVDAAGLLRLLALTDDLARPGAAPTDDLGAAVLRLRRCASACAGAVRRQPPEPLDGVGATCRTFNASEPAVRKAEKAYREACAEKHYYDGRIMELDGAAPADKKQRRREKHLRAVEGLDAAEQALAAALGARARARAPSAATLDAGLEQRVSLAVEVGHYDGKTASLEGAADGDRVARNAEKRETAARLLEEHDHRLDEAFCAYDEVRVAVNARAAAALLGALDALWGGASGGAAPVS
ncbi:hypothetical protein SO694_00035157 [Aureococcus anophagefferens]|uniref:BAR domain-containing protein n=1 Tax=Aureococcus anophagefferens TaxID=44056 RepID=A0ABR1FKM2_AURAN